MPAGQADRRPADHRPLRGRCLRGEGSALELYAEDYVTKPFDPTSFVARIQRVLRRAPVGHPQIVLDGGDVEVDLATRRLSTPRATHQLSPTEARLLQVLAASVDWVILTEELLDRV